MLFLKSHHWGCLAWWSFIELNTECQLTATYPGCWTSTCVPVFKELKFSLVQMYDKHINKIQNWIKVSAWKVTKTQLGRQQAAVGLSGKVTAEQQFGSWGRRLSGNLESLLGRARKIFPRWEPVWCLRISKETIQPAGGGEETESLWETNHQGHPYLPRGGSGLWGGPKAGNFVYNTHLSVARSDIKAIKTMAWSQITWIYPWFFHLESGRSWVSVVFICEMGVIIFSLWYCRKN